MDEGVDELEEQTLTNVTTLEQFSVKKEEKYAGLFDVKIKRGMNAKSTK